MSSESGRNLVPELKDLQCTSLVLLCENYWFCYLFVGPLLKSRLSAFCFRYVSGILCMCGDIL